VLKVRIDSFVSLVVVVVLEEEEDDVVVATEEAGEVVVEATVEWAEAKEEVGVDIDTRGLALSDRSCPEPKGVFVPFFSIFFFVLFEKREKNGGFGFCASLSGSSAYQCIPYRYPHCLLSECAVGFVSGLPCLISSFLGFSLLAFSVCFAFFPCQLFPPTPAAFLVVMARACRCLDLSIAVINKHVLLIPFAPCLRRSPSFFPIILFPSLSLSLAQTR
jgi:hypothetical protein